MKKRILIVNNNMHIGGVQKALANLLSFIHDKYDVTLLLFYPHGEYMKDIPANVKVLSVNSDYKYLGMTKYDVKGRPFRYLKRCFYAALTKTFGRNTVVTLMSLFQKKIKGYDVAISYLQNSADKMFYGGCNDFVIKHTDAPVKAGVLHCDYRKCGADTELNAKLYSKFDIIAACSEGCRDSFVSCVPELSAKTKVQLNFHDFSEIEKLASCEIDAFSNDKINILMVARLGKEKGVLRAVKAVNALGALKDRINLYIIGDGIEREKIELYIEKEAMSDIVFLLGEKANPYPYMKQCDLFLISSLSEAAPMVIGEAAFLGAPILSTRTSSAIEMIERTGYGWVCENDEGSLTSELMKLLSSDRIEAKRKELSAYDFNNIAAESQFDSLIQNAD